MLLINISVVYLRSYILNEYSFANLVKHTSKILSKVLWKYTFWHTKQIIPV